MSELRVECLAERADVPDLGFTLRRGEVVWVAPDSLAKSACLRALQDIRAVSVVSMSRCATMRKPAPPAYRLSQKGVSPRVREPRPEHGPPSVPQDIDTRIEQAVAGAMDKLADRLVAVLGQQRPSGAAPVNEQALAQVVAVAVSQALAQQGPLPTTGAGPRTRLAPEEPVYIPTGIVSSETPSDFQVTAQAADAGDLAGAASALRKTRTRKGTSE